MTSLSSFLLPKSEKKIKTGLKTLDQRWTDNGGKNFGFSQDFSIFFGFSVKGGEGRMHRSAAIGIDLGTAYSCVAALQRGRVEIIPNEQGHRITPSYVSFTETGCLIGDAAKNQVNMNPANTVFDAKRLIGRKFSDPSVQSVQSDKKRWPFKVICGSKDKPMIVVTHKCQEKQFTAEDISSMVVAKMKEIAVLGSMIAHTRRAAEVLKF